jgi:signal transduction histidine kinase
MIKLNPFAISGLLIFLTSIPLFMLILPSWHKKLSKVFFFHILSIFLWGTGAIITGLISSSLESCIPTWKIAFTPVPFIATTFFHSVSILNDTRKNKILIYLLYLQATYFTIITLSGHMFIPRYETFGSLIYPHGSIHFKIAFIIWGTLIFAAHSIMIKHYKKINYGSRKNLFFFIIATTIGYLGSITNFLPCFGIHIYPFGNFLIPIHSIIVAYAILRHQFLDINIVVKKSIIYTILISFVFVSYLVIIVITERLLQNFLGYQSLIISGLSAFTLGIIFVPLRSKIQYFLDKIFFHGSQIEISEQNERLQKEILKSERHRILATMASGMAHEIKNPLTPIKIFAENLPEKLEDKEFLTKFAGIVQHEVDRIDSLVNQLLDYSKPIPLKLENIELHPFLNQTLDFLNSQMLKQMIKTSTKFAKQPVFIYADKQQMKQAFLNILLNAIEAMSKGGQLTISTQIIKNQNVEINIQDTGPGIPEELLKKIWEPFYTSKTKGTGLGLAITRNIIKEHSGKITIKTEEKIGTQFIITLPKTIT